MNRCGVSVYMTEQGTVITKIKPRNIRVLLMALVVEYICTMTTATTVVIAFLFLHIFCAKCWLYVFKNEVQFTLLEWKC